jgi:hypothetical protein
MKNPIIEYLQQRRKAKLQKTNQETQRQLLGVLSAMEACERQQLLFIDAPNRRVLISDIISAPWANNDKLWHNFFRNVGLWLQFRLSQEQWNKRRIAIESKAMREARQKYANLTREELRIICVKAQEQLANEPDEPIRDEYEFCICDGLLRSDAKAEAIGTWKNGKLTMKVIP